VDCIPLDPAWVETPQALRAKYLRLTGQTDTACGNEPPAAAAHTANR
jgi:hypothetical protein